MSNLSERDPKTGHFIPGNTAASKGNRHVAQRRAQLTAALLDCVTDEDFKECYRAHLDCIKQTTDVKSRIQALALYYEWFMQKPEQNINVQSETRSLNANVNISQEEQQVLESIIAKNSLSPTASVVQLPPVE